LLCQPTQVHLELIHANHPLNVRAQAQTNPHPFYSIPQHFGFHRKDTTVATKQGHNDNFAEANLFRFKFMIAKSTLKTDANAKSPKLASNRLKLVGFLYVTMTARSAKIFAVTKDAENWQGNANLNL
jgi:hypothetical protein